MHDCGLGIQMKGNENDVVLLVPTHTTRISKEGLLNVAGYGTNDNEVTSLLLNIGSMTIDLNTNYASPGEITKMTIIAKLL